MIDFDSDKMKELQSAMQEREEEYRAEANAWWESLSEDEQLKAFYSVCQRIHKGDIVDQGSYRWVLYDVFGFSPESYIVGMECGYMDIHNAIIEKKEDE